MVGVDLVDGKVVLFQMRVNKFEELFLAAEGSFNGVVYDLGGLIGVLEGSVCHLL